MKDAAQEDRMSDHTCTCSDCSPTPRGNKCRFEFGNYKLRREIDEVLDLLANERRRVKALLEKISHLEELLESDGHLR
jgi:hypothetical protein